LGVEDEVKADDDAETEVVPGGVIDVGGGTIIEVEADPLLM